MSNPLFGANCWIWESPVTVPVIAALAPKIKGWGFDVIEIPLEAPGDWDPAAVREILDAHDLQASLCVAMAPGRDLTTSDASTVRATQDYLIRALEAAAVIGSKAISGPIYAPTGVTGVIGDAERRERIARVADHLQPVLFAAERTGVGIAIEPLNRFETSLFNTVEQTMSLLDAVAHPSLGLLLDTFHMNIEERDPAAAIRLAGDRLIHFHACGNDRGAPGPGALPWPAIRDALRDTGYSGALVIESFTSANATIAAAAAIWRPLAPTQDAIAVDGLAFLRGVFG